MSERPSDELRRAGVKLETNTLAYSGLFYVSWVVSYQINTAFLALRRRKERNAFMSEKIIRIRSGNEESTMSVTEEEYLKYYRPWWQMKKKEQRNREAMELNGYTEESYEEWKENDMRTELFAESMEELAEKRMLLDVLRDAMDSLLPEERELAMKVFGEEMQVSEFAKSKNESRTTVSSRKQRVLEKLRLFFEDRGFDVYK